jgi:hypothetical protein
VSVIAVAAALIVGVSYLVSTNRHDSAPAVGTSIPVASHIYTSTELVGMWHTQPAICNRPFGTEDKKPPDPDGIMGKTPWPDAGTDVVAKLNTITSPLSAEKIREKMHFLGVVVYRTKSEFVDDINQGTDAAPAAKEAFRTAIKLRYKGYVARINTTLNEIADAPVFPVEGIPGRYDVDWVCPRG